jgi:hypothetical protein
VTAIADRVVRAARALTPGNAGDVVSW